MVLFLFVLLAGNPPKKSQQRCVRKPANPPTPAPAFSMFHLGSSMLVLGRW